MPIYQYQCQECGHQLEALQKMSDAVLTDCPACQASALKKQLTAAAFQLKGTGWYATDFKDKGSKPVTSSRQENSAGTKDASNVADSSSNRSTTSSTTSNKKEASTAS